MRKKEKTTIGWREEIAIPAFGIKATKVKVDTGARTSALHVTKLKIIKRGQTLFAEFYVHPNQDSSAPRVKNRYKIEGFRMVKSSNSISSKRPVVKTDIIIGSLRKEIEITLVNRDLMGFRMLLGRSALKGQFIVDVSKSYLLKKSSQQKRNK